MKHINLYLDLVGIREIVIVRSRGDRIKYYELRLVDNISSYGKLK